MKVLLAGATGASGVPLVRRLITAGHEVTGITRTEAGASLMWDLGASSVLADALDRDAPELEMLKAKLDTGHGEGKMKRFGLRAWKWPFTSKDVKATLVIIGRQRDLLNLASTADTMYVSPIEFLYVLSDSFRGLSLAIDQRCHTASA